MRFELLLNVKIVDSGQSFSKVKWFFIQNNRKIDV